MFLFVKWFKGKKIRLFENPFKILYRRYNPNKEKKQSQNCFAKSKISHTFAVHMELRCHFCWLKSEKGIRCESGTIPVAVYLDFHLESLSLLHSLPLVNTGKAQQTRWVRRPTCAFRRLVPAGYGCESKLVFSIIVFWDDYGHSLGLP